MTMTMTMIMTMRMKNKNIQFRTLKSQINKKRFFINLTNRYIKMNYYWFNRQEILQKAKERYSKERAGKYYLRNKEAIKEKAKEHYKIIRRWRGRK